jgi:cyclopropane-fatty-acyl-phospholipid synthase
LEYAQTQARCSGLSNKLDYQLIDYRDIEGQFDAIMSVEMVEAVGQEYWGVYLDKIANLLRPDGRAAIQYIAIADDIFEKYASNVDFIQTYIFPGGMLLSESQFRTLAEERGLEWCEPVHFGRDYAQTLLMWRKRFDDAAENGRLPNGFDTHFTQLWRFYLMYCEGGFRGGGIYVGQVTLVKSGECA